MDKVYKFINGRVQDSISRQVVCKDALHKASETLSNFENYSADSNIDYSPDDFLILISNEVEADMVKEGCFNMSAASQVGWYFQTNHTVNERLANSSTDGKLLRLQRDNPNIIVRSFDRRRRLWKRLKSVDVIKGGLLCCHHFHSEEYDALLGKIIPQKDFVEIDLQDIDLIQDSVVLAQILLIKKEKLLDLLEELKAPEDVQIYGRLILEAYSFFAENDYDSGNFVRHMEKNAREEGCKEIVGELKVLHEEFVKKACDYQPCSPVNQAMKQFFSLSTSNIKNVLRLDEPPSKTALFLLGMLWGANETEDKGFSHYHLSSHLSLLLDRCTSMELKDGHIRINLQAFDEKVDERRAEVLKQYYDISKSINDLKDKEEELTLERQQHSKRNSDLQNEVKELKVAGSVFDKERKKLKEENAEIQKQNETLKTDITGLKDEGKKLIEAKDKLADKNSSLKGEIDEVETAGRDMEEKNSAQGEGNAEEESVDSSSNIQGQTEMDIKSDESSETED